MTDFDINKDYNRYCEDILDKKINACENIFLACKRYKDWFNRDDMWFDYHEVDRRIKFVSKIKHYKGDFAGKNFILLPYQQWIFANIFGWKWKENNLRVTKKVLLFMARKGGKTALAAALALSQMIQDNNNGQEIDFVANNGAQAKLGFDCCKNFAESIDPNGLIFKRFRDTIKMPITKSEIAVRNSESMTLDGLNSSTFILDEYHAAKTTEIYDVLKTSQGAQSQPLAIVITTAGFLLDGYPLFEMKKVCEEILRGSKNDDSQFSALYAIEDGDDWMNDESCWIKANPSLGFTNKIETLREDVLSVENQPSNEFNVLTKLFNKFVQSSQTWLPYTLIKDHMVKDIDFQSLNKKEMVWAAVDLSNTKDLTCFTIMMQPNKDRIIYPDKYIFKTWVFVSEYGVNTSVNKVLYKQWIEDGYLIQIPGNVVDYDVVMNYLLDQKQFIRYDNIGYDKFNATQFVINCEKKGLPMQMFSQSLSSFNIPTKEFERMILTDQVVIDYSPVVTWAFNNVVLRIDRMENVKPDKPTKEAKIDPVITIVQALGTYLYTTGKYLSDSEIYSGQQKAQK